MKERKQKISEDTWPQKDRAAPDSYVGGQTFMRITENNLTDNSQLGYGMLEFILSPANLNAAYRQVKRNKGAGGADKMEVESLKDYLVRHKEELTATISAGKYRPNPVRRVEIPKDNGSKRQLGIPTVVDRGRPTSHLTGFNAPVRAPIFKQQLTGSGLGAVPARLYGSANSTSQKGYVYAVDMDLEKFFDTVNHSKLIEVLSRTVKDGRVISLIHRFY
jgi:RNA-directed DNA polymerase